MKVTKGMDWIITCTTNFEETVAFFRDVLGLPVKEAGIPVTDRQFRRYAQIAMPNDSVLEVVEPEDAVRKLYDAPIPSITVDDVVHSRKEMENKRVEFVSEIFRTGSGWGWTYFRAPDGNVYQLQGPC